MNRRIHETRKRSRPKSRWRNQVMKLIKEMKIKNWMTVAEQKEKWRIIVKEAKVDNGL